jgi:hypothetical protein
MGHQQQGTSAAGAFEARDKILAFGIVANQIAGNAMRIGHLLKVIGDGCLISRRVGGVDFDQVDQILARSVWKRPVIVSHPDG